jgi:hypothetical protein
VSRTETVSAESARGLRKLLIGYGRRQYGFLPGISQVLLPDLVVTAGGSMLYSRLHLSRRSRLSRLQREMVATVVNGKIGGAP